MLLDYSSWWYTSNPVLSGLKCSANRPTLCSAFKALWPFPAFSVLCQSASFCSIKFMLARFTPPPTLRSSLPLAFPAMKWEQARWARELTLPDSSPQTMTDNLSPLSVEHLGGARWALSPRGFLWAYCQLSTILHGVCPQSTVRRPDLVSVMTNFSQLCLDTLR